MELEHEIQTQFLQALLIAGSGLACGMMLVLAISSIVRAFHDDSVGHIALALARLGGALVIGLIGEALWRSPQPPPPSGRAWAYAAALFAIAIGYAVALFKRTASG